MEALQLDLCNLSSVHACAQQLLAREQELHFVILNAGVMGGPLKHTAHGWESHIASNHIGHLLLCQLLLPRLQNQVRHWLARVLCTMQSAHMDHRSVLQNLIACRLHASNSSWIISLTGSLSPVLQDSACRIIVLSSVAHEWGHKWLDLDDLHFERRKYHDMGAYAQSKLANLLFARELSTRSVMAEYMRSVLIAWCLAKGPA